LDLRAELADLKNRTLPAIEKAAELRDTRQIVHLSALLADIERDEQAATALEERVAAYEARLQRPDEVPAVPQPRQVVKVIGHMQNRRDPRVARAMRVDYAIAHGLGNLGGTMYRTRSGSTVGVAAATEVTPNRWFLGITPKHTELDTMVLLCQSGNAVLDFVLPMTFLSDAWPRLSRSGGQVKFNVDRRDGSYWLQVPDVGPLDIGRYRGQHRPLT
jgi:hypothetical protein